MKTSFLLAACTLMLSPAVQAEESPLFYYVSVSGSTDLATSAELEGELDTGSSVIDIGMDLSGSGETSIRGAVGLGSRSESEGASRAEIEYARIVVGIDETDSHSTAGRTAATLYGEGAMTGSNIALNGYVDLHFTENWMGYAGLGFGLFSSDMEVLDSVTGLSWQMMCGLGYNFTEHFALYGGYRLFMIPELEFSNHNLDATISRLMSHNLEVGLRITF